MTSSGHGEHHQPRFLPAAGDEAAPGIGAVVFDLDGTLADTMALAPRAYPDTVRSLGGPTVSPDEVVATWNIRDLPDLTSAVYLEQRADVEHYLAMMDQLSGEALTPTDNVRWM